MFGIKKAVTVARNAIGFTLIGAGGIATFVGAGGGEIAYGLAAGAILCGLGTVLVNGRKAFTVPEGGGATADKAYSADYGYDLPAINPATGFIMVGGIGGVDTAGNPYGVNNTTNQ